MYQGALSDYHLTATGMGYLIPQSTAPAPDPVPTTDLMTGLSLTLPVLDRVGFYSNMSVSAQVGRKREVAFRYWQQWSLTFPPLLRPSLLTCTPHEVACFLEQWRSGRKGRRKPTDPEGYIPDISPGTLRNMASQMAGLFLAAGRSADAWTPTRREGNPLNNAVVKNYLDGYEFYCFESTSYVVSGAVPMTLDLFLRLLSFLIVEADKADSPRSRALLLRDATLSAYLWETGQRGKEGGELLLTDFSYADLSCTEAWGDLKQGKPQTLDPLLVESSRGTKSRKSKHPGTLELQLEISEEDGSGYLVALLPLSSAAMTACGSPLTRCLFKTSDAGSSSFSEGLSAGAFNKRLQRHLQCMHSWNGETAHSLRRGSTQLLRAQGASVDEIAERRLWRRDTTVDLYLHLSRHRSRLISSGPAAVPTQATP